MDAPTVTDAAELLTGTAASATSSATAIHWLDRDRSLTYGESVDAMARAAVVLAGFGVRDRKSVV